MPPLVSTGPDDEAAGYPRRAMALKSITLTAPSAAPVAQHHHLDGGIYHQLRHWPTAVCASYSCARPLPDLPALASRAGLNNDEILSVARGRR